MPVTDDFRSARDSLLAQDILRYSRDHLAPFKRIRRLEFAALPKTICGKIRRVELRRNEELRHIPRGGAIPPGGAGIAGISGAGVGIEYSEADFPAPRDGSARGS